MLKIVDPVVEIFKTIHKSVESISIDYRSSLSRYNYVTPTSYLELLKVFQIILKEKTNELIFSINRLKTGLDKLIQANHEVSDMQIMLKDLQPQLEKSAKDTEELMIIIEKEKKEA
jgi:dynein heavy chain